jgi:hypothetical protein
LDEPKRDDFEDSDAVAEELSRAEKLETLGRSLAATRDKWIRARTNSGWDREVEKDLDAYHMRDWATRHHTSLMESVERGGGLVGARDVKPTRSTLFVGVTRQRTNAGEARFTEIVLPNDDQNWAIKPTPDPEGARALEDNGVLVDPTTGQPVLIDPETGARTDDPQVGQPIEKREIAKAAQRVANAAAKGMTTEISDQLVEGDYLGEVRKAIHDSAVMGTGVLKGPIVIKKVNKVWRQKPVQDPETGAVKQVYALASVENLRPASYRVDPRNVWEDPDCGDDIQNGTGIFELDRKVEKRVRQLLKEENYLKEQLVKVLEEGPKRSAALPLNIESSRDLDGNLISEDNKLYYHWIYWGEIDRKDLEAAGLPVPNDPADIVSMCVEMINDTVVRAYPNPLDRGELPYDFFAWDPVTGKVRGLGQPYLMRAEQAATNAAWRQMMDNSGITAGPQILANRRGIKPADGQWVLRPFKFWDIIDDSIDPNNVFRAVEFSSHQSELAGIIEMAQRLGDQSSGQPMLSQGDLGSAPETVGTTQLLMNSADVVLRRRVKVFDDRLTKPHIRRYYDFNMAYSDKEEVKGDFEVDARGSTALIAKDLQNQSYVQLLQAATSPAFGPLINLKKLFEKVLKSQHIDPNDILNTDEEIQRIQDAAQQQTDPRIEAAKINAEARMKQAEAVAQNRAEETEVLREAEVENRRLRVMQLQQQRDIEILKLAQAQQTTVQQINAQLAQTALKQRTDKELAASEMLFKTKVSPDGKGV